MNTLEAGTEPGPRCKVNNRKRIPEWIRSRFASDTTNYKKLSGLLEKEHLNTVCQEANCPNIYNCFGEGTLTFMVLGNICTRNCSYCNVSSGIPYPLDKDEPKRIAREIEMLKLDYTVITCVTRDDLDDGGAGVFVETVREIRNINPRCRMELLISDLKGDWEALKRIVDAAPQVLGHNVEVAREFFSTLRPQGSYERSLELLKNIKRYNPGLITKSGMMIGVGETRGQIIQTMKDLIDTGCSIMTIGQYLSPTPAHAPVEKFYTPQDFTFFKEAGESMGIACVESGPLVRSSYKAKNSYEKLMASGIWE